MALDKSYQPLYCLQYVVLQQKPQEEGSCLLAYESAQTLSTSIYSSASKMAHGGHVWLAIGRFRAHANDDALFTARSHMQMTERATFFFLLNIFWVVGQLLGSDCLVSWNKAFPSVLPHTVAKPKKRVCC